MEIRRLVRLPNGRHVARISVVMMLRSLWHIVSGSRLRRHMEWKRMAAKAEADRKRRSEAGRKAWETRRRNAEIARALNAYDATILTQTHQDVLVIDSPTTPDNIEGVPV